jgi:membrane-associated protease RseP (regulator of RpoE activity)
MHVSAINIILSFAGALVFLEMGHFLAARACRVPVTQAGFGWGPKLFGFRVNGVDYQLRLLPVGAYIRMDMSGLQRRPLFQQLFVLLAGIAVNLILGAIAWGTFFGTLNLVLAVGNLFPLYQQDGWKSGMVIFRRIFRQPSPLVEWSFTLSAGLIGLILLMRALFGC